MLHTYVYTNNRDKYETVSGPGHIFNTILNK